MIDGYSTIFSPHLNKFNVKNIVGIQVHKRIRPILGRMTWWIAPSITTKHHVLEAHAADDFPKFLWCAVRSLKQMIGAGCNELCIDSAEVPEDFVKITAREYSRSTNQVPPRHIATKGLAMP